MAKETSKNKLKVKEVRLVYKNTAKSEESIIIQDSRAAFNLLLDHWDKNKIQLLEESKVLFLDHRKACLGLMHLASGGITSCIIDPRIVFASALMARATSLILAHNHPTGSLQPSLADRSLTNKLSVGANYLELELLDHLIISPNAYYSMADNGLVP